MSLERPARGARMIPTMELARITPTKETWAMDVTGGSVPAAVGARFYDHNRRDLGRAARVVKRPPALGGLTVLDVMTAEPVLAAYLRALDKARLVVRCEGAEGASYRFAWASGYANGNEIRVQGVLE
jgi:hypothetical protein